MQNLDPLVDFEGYPIDIAQFPTYDSNSKGHLAKPIQSFDLGQLLLYGGVSVLVL
jgi:hypothetical protein